jgi:hypothetical protein
MFNQNQLHSVEATSPTVTPPVPPNKDKTMSNTETVENTEIYYMPDNFRKNNQVAGHKVHIPGVWVLVITIFLLICLGGGLYIYWLQPSFLTGLFKPSAVTPSETSINKEIEPPIIPPAEPTDTQTNNSAKQVYSAFRIELAGANTPEAYLFVYSKYATNAKYESLKTEKDRFELTYNETEVLTKLREMGLPLLDGTEDISEISSDTETTLTITKTNNRESGKVVFVLEEGQWKVSQEIWNQEVSSGNETGIIQPGVDDDEDGLTNEEEIALGTNPKAVDSDGDTYGDLAEINNEYNPTGEGKLSQNKNLASYLNTTFNLSLLYPVSWKRTIASTDDSIMLTAPENQFIQVLVQPNGDRETIADWYKRTFEVDTIPSNQLLTAADWQGVRSPDGLSAYVTNKDKSYIFTVTYNLGSLRTLNYKNLFELMLRSLKITA